MYIIESKEVDLDGFNLTLEFKKPFSSRGKIYKKELLDGIKYLTEFRKKFIEIKELPTTIVSKDLFLKLYYWFGGL